jgi:hypothetical protein
VSETNFDKENGNEAFHHKKTTRLKIFKIKSRVGGRLEGAFKPRKFLGEMEGKREVVVLWKLCFGMEKC